MINFCLASKWLIWRQTKLLLSVARKHNNQIATFDQNPNPNLFQCIIVDLSNGH